MAGAQGIRAGKAYVELGADSEPLNAGLQAAQARLKKFGGDMRSIGLSMAAVGTSILAPMGLAVRQFATSGDQLNDMAARTGVAADLLSQLGYAARRSGTDLTIVEMASRKLSVAVGAVANGSKSAADGFAAIGIDAKALLKLDPTDQFMSVAGAISAIEDPALRAAAAVKVFGRTGTMILPMLRNLPKLAAESKKLGAAMSQEQIAAADKLNDEFERMAGATTGAANAIGGALAPKLTAVVAKLVDMMSQINAFIAANPTFVTVVGAAAVSLTALAAAFTAVGVAASLAAVAMKGFALASIPFKAIGGWLAVAFRWLTAMPTVILAVAATLRVATAVAAGLATTFGLIAIAIASVGFMVYKLIDAFDDLADAKERSEYLNSEAGTKAEMDRFRKGRLRSVENQKREAAMASVSSGKIPDLGAALSSPVGSKLDVSGAFDAAAAFGMGVGSSMMDKLVDYARQTAENTAEIAGADGLAFGG